MAFPAVMSRGRARPQGKLLSLQTGSRLNYVENPDTVIDNLREIAPTSLLAVPRIWEKLYSLSTLTVKDATRLQKWAYAWALARRYRWPQPILKRKGNRSAGLLAFSADWWLAAPAGAGQHPALSGSCTA